MKIHEAAGRLRPPEQRRPENSAGKNTGTPVKSTQGDRVSLSEEARMFEADRKNRPETKDERMKRLDELRSQVRSGAYKPDIRDVAMSLIRDEGTPFS